MTPGEWVEWIREETLKRFEAGEMDEAIPTNRRVLIDAIAAAVLEETTTLRGALEAYFNFAPGGYVMWEQLMEALENEWRIAHNDYCGCSLDGRMKCDHPKPKALATEARQ